jgi:hypothetical protein
MSAWEYAAPTTILESRPVFFGVDSRWGGFQKGDADLQSPSASLILKPTPVDTVHTLIGLQSANRNQVSKTVFNLGLSPRRSQVDGEAGGDTYQLVPFPAAGAVSA